MPRCPVEEERLRALASYDILDTPVEARFDRLTKHTAWVFGVPVCLVTLVDEQRQWFKSRLGFEKEETSRDVAFCAYTIQSDELFVVEDATRDARFALNPLVTGAPGIRFYAGAPLKTAGGHRLGSLCIIDTNPRSLTEEEREVLRTLADIVEEELERSRLVAVAAQEAERTRKAESRFQRMVQNGADVITVLDATGHAQYQSPAVTRFLGYAPEQLIGVDVFGYIHPDDVDRVREGFKALVAEGGNAVSMFRFRAQGGAWVWLEATVANLLSDDSVAGIVVNSRDITEWKEAQTALIKSESRHRIVLNRTGQLIYDYDVSTGHITWSGAITQTTGYTPEAFASVDIAAWEAHLHPDDRARAVSHLNAAMQRVDNYDIGYRFRDSGGVYRHIYDLGVFLPDDTGQATRMLGVMRDVTARKHAEDRLRESEGRYRALSELVATFAFSYRVAAPGEVLLEWVTGTVEDVLGYAPNKLVGNPWGALVVGDDAVLTQQRLKKVLAGETVIDELRMKRGDGEVRWYRMAAYPEWDEGHEHVVRIYGAGQDITGQKEREQELIEAKHRAEEMSRLKDSFLTNMNHEIRTPLTAVIGFAGVLVEELEGENNHMARIIHDSGERLKDTLDAVMDLAQLESGSLYLQAQWLDLAALASEAVEVFQAQAHEAGLALMLAPADGPVHALLDRGAVLRMLSNLISNALKFTRKGSVDVSVGSSGEVERRVWLRVADSGIGIDPTFLPHLFDEFRQESGGLSRSYEGSGLGLTITRKLVEKMGGEIEVESEKGKGSIFTVYLPTLPIQAAT